MSGFSANWLTLREPHDIRSRSPVILDVVAAFYKGYSRLRIVDLACGTGSTMRALGPRLPGHQDWKLIDNDMDLLAHAAVRSLSDGATVTTAILDLDKEIEYAFDGTFDLITTSALLDLVSDDWLERLANMIAAYSIPFYAALSYDGRIEFSPNDEFDAAIATAVNAHQRTDKGFGLALGPTAVTAAVSRFEAIGYSVVQGASDWQIGPSEHQMQTELLAGWTDAASEVGTFSIADMQAWCRRRNDFVAAGRSSLKVGHVDFFAVPMTAR